MFFFYLYDDYNSFRYFCGEHWDGNGQVDHYLDGEIEYGGPPFSLLRERGVDIKCTDI